MKRPAETSDEFLNLMVDWQSVETETIGYTKKEIPKTGNPLTRTILQALKLEAEKHCLIQQMIVESVKKQAVNLSPEELTVLSNHLNRQMAVEEKNLSTAEQALEKSELFISRYLLSYLISDLKHQNELFRELDDELKSASIPTSATSKIFDS
ncbi:MAG: hypothetical protein M0Z59_09500 [Nitrospiraceae bacterium]|nr:hypothetical protein [Nitrospiraceae bacterium]